MITKDQQTRVNDAMAAWRKVSEVTLQLVERCRANGINADDLMAEFTAASEGVAAQMELQMQTCRKCLSSGHKDCRVSVTPRDAS